MLIESVSVFCSYRANSENVYRVTSYTDVRCTGWVMDAPPGEEKKSKSNVVASGYRGGSETTRGGLTVTR